MERIKWIDGLRGISAFGVYLHHFIVAFIPAAFFGAGAPVRLFKGADLLLAQSPLAFPTVGNFLVCLFCIVSGLVISNQVMYSPNPEGVAYVIAKRYLRMALPLFVISLIVYLLMRQSLFTNVEASKITGSSWLASYYIKKTSLRAVFLTSFNTVWFVGDNTFSTAFWMMSILFKGTFLSILLGEISWKYKKSCIYFYIALALVFIRIDSMYLLFVLGTILSYLMKNVEDRGKKYQFLWMLVLAAGLFLGGYPSGIEPTNIYRVLWLPAYLTKFQFFHIVGAFFTVLGILYLQLVQRFLSFKGFLWLGRNAFALFLVHIPILFSLSTTLLINIHSRMGGYQKPLAVVFLFTTATVLTASNLFHRIVEKRCYKLTDALLLKLEGM